MGYLQDLKPVTDFYRKPVISRNFGELIIDFRYYKPIYNPGYRYRNNFSANIKCYNNVICFNRLKTDYRFL